MITHETLRYRGIDGLLDYVVCADMVEKDKPDPEMIFKTLDALKVEKDRSVMVGDSIVDMEMGRRAGVGLVIGVLEGGIADRKVLSEKADVVIDSVRDIEAIV